MGHIKEFARRLSRRNEDEQRRAATELAVVRVTNCRLQAPTAKPVEPGLLLQRKQLVPGRSQTRRHRDEKQEKIRRRDHHHQRRRYRRGQQLRADVQSAT